MGAVGGVRRSGALRGGPRAVLAVAVGAGGWGGVRLVMAVVLAEVVALATLWNLLLQLVRKNDAGHLNRLL